jgi:ribonuclease HI
MTNRIDIFTDGSCLGNPGPGGWGVLIRNNDNNGDIEMSGSQPDTTNNRMEMSAVLKAFEYLIEHDISDSLLSIHTDSSLVVNTFTQNWKKKKNTDLWALIETAYSKLYSKGNTFEWNWVKGHAGHEENERVDDLARWAAESLTS